jgi:hypothetical protein
MRIAPLDWSLIDTVLLDMDGTLLDLRFDQDDCLPVLGAARGYGRRLAAGRPSAGFVPAPPYTAPFTAVDGVADLFPRSRLA